MTDGVVVRLTASTPSAEAAEPVETTQAEEQTPTADGAYLVQLLQFLLECDEVGVSAK